jgi:hypothetical protein
LLARFRTNSVMCAFQLINAETFGMTTFGDFGYCHRAILQQLTQELIHGWRCNLHPASERAYENHQWISLADYLLEQSGLDDYAEQEE